MMRIRWAGCAAVIVVSLSACSATKSGTPTTPGPGTRSRSAPSSTSAAPSAPSSGPGTSGGPLTEAQVQASLLTASDIAAGFTDGTYTKSDKSQPCAPAGSPSFRARTSPKIDVGARLVHATPQAALDEQIFVYSDAAAAQQALSVGKNGLNCASGTVYYTDGTRAPITISQAADVSADLGVDSGVAWQLRNKDVKGTQVAVALGPLVLTLSFAAAAGTDTTSLPDAITVARAAIAKIRSS